MKTHFFSFSSATFMAGIVAASVLLASGRAVDAAVITWTETVVDTTDDDASPGAGLGDAAVSTIGLLMEAANFGTATDVTVNGVQFSGLGLDAPTNLMIGYDPANNFSTSTGTSTGGAIDELTTTFGRDTGVSFHSTTLTGLIVGQEYEVQFLASFAGLGRTSTFDDGAGNFIEQFTDDPHSFSNGTFTADARTQTVNMTLNTGSQFLNAYQLRNVDLNPVFGMSLTIDRDTGSLTLSTDIESEIVGYSLSSPAGALDQAGWVPFSDSDSDWTVLADPSSITDLSEFESGGGTGETINLLTPLELSSSGAYVNSPVSGELVMEVILPGEGVIEVPVVYSGSDALDGDFDFDDDVDEDDFAIFINNHLGTFPGLLPVQSYQLGDMNSDLTNDFLDLQLFRSAYDSFNGGGAFAAAMAAVPEPTSSLLIICGTPALLLMSRRIERTEFKQQELNRT